MDEDRNTTDSRSVPDSLSEDSAALEERTTTQDFEGWLHAFTNTDREREEVLWDGVPQLFHNTPHLLNPTPLSYPHNR